MYIFKLYSNITCFSYISMFPLIYLCLLRHSHVILYSGTSICFHINTSFLIYLVKQTHMHNTCLNVNMFTYLYSNIMTYNHLYSYVSISDKMNHLYFNPIPQSVILQPPNPSKNKHSNVHTHIYNQHARNSNHKLLLYLPTLLI